MATARDIIRIKGDHVWTVTPDATVLEALEIMAGHNISSLVVQENNEIVGIFTERDFIRGIVSKGQCLIHTQVQEYMVTDTNDISPDMPLHECVHLMLDKRVRHLPVVENEHLIGLISIGDVLSQLVKEDEGMINNLEEFIEGRGYGR